MSQKMYVASPGLQVAGSRLLALVSVGERRQGCSNGNIPYRETVPLIQDHDFAFCEKNKTIILGLCCSETASSQLS